MEPFQRKFEDEETKTLVCIQLHSWKLESFQIHKQSN